MSYRHCTLETYAYKTVGDGQSLILDVHLPDVTKFGVVAALSRQIMMQAAGGKKSATPENHALPVMVFFHGGGSVSGNRAAFQPRWLFQDALDAGFAVVSPDYTLLTPRTAHDQLADVKDLFTFISEKLNPLLANAASQHLVNTDKITVTGSSAGAYLAYLAALHALPRPKALATVYGAGGDLLTDFYLQPKTAPWCMGQPLIPNGDAFKDIISASRDTWVVRTGEDHSKDPRHQYYPWLVQNGTFLDAITGKAGLSAELRALAYDDRATALPSDVEALFPRLSPIDQSFPPFFYLHSTGDEAVPIEESRNFARKVKDAGVKVEAVELEGLNHAFDLGYKSSKEHAVLEKMVPFLLKHVQ